MENFKPTVSKFLDNRKKKKDGTFPVKLTIYYQGKKKVYKSGVDLNREEYDSLYAGNLRNDELKIKRRKIEFLMSRAQDIISKLDDFTFEAFNQTYLNQKSVRRTSSLQELFEAYIRQLEDNEQIGTAQSYKCTISSILRFKTSPKLNEITLQWLKDYEKYMVQRNASPSTIGIYLRQLRRIVNIAISNRLLSADRYPFKGYAIPASRNVKKALNENQVIALLNYETADTHKGRALDFWLFSYVCNGMNMADICLLTKDRIQGDFFHYFRAKTKNTKKKDLRPIKVPLTEISRQVMKQWGNADLRSKYVFPVLKEGLTPKQIKYKIQDFIAYVNKHMKLVAADVGIEGNIGTYVARHTHSTILKRKGVPTELIKENLGHSSLITTESYLADFPDDVKLGYARLLTEL